jgi:hypothetical protein
MTKIDFENLPLNSEELILILDKMFPEKSPTPQDLQDNPYEVAAYSGKRELIRMLQSKLEHTLSKLKGENNAVE